MVRKTLPLSMPPEKQTPIGSLAGTGVQPLRDFFGQRGDVDAADGIEIGGQRAGCGREEARVDGIGIGAADKLQFDDVVRRHHARVAGVKLRVQTFGLEPVEDGVDAVSHDQRRAFSAFGQKIAHGPVERARHLDGLARPREQGEGAFDSPHGFRRMLEQKLAGVVDAQVVDLVCFGVRQVDDSFNIVVHNQPQRECAVQIQSTRVQAAFGSLLSHVHLRTWIPADRTRAIALLRQAIYTAI